MFRLRRHITAPVTAEASIRGQPDLSASAEMTKSSSYLTDPIQHAPSAVSKQISGKVSRFAPHVAASKSAIAAISRKKRRLNERPSQPMRAGTDAKSDMTSTTVPATNQSVVQTAAMNHSTYRPPAYSPSRLSSEKTSVGQVMYGYGMRPSSVRWLL